MFYCFPVFWLVEAVTCQQVKRRWSAHRPGPSRYWVCFAVWLGGGVWILLICGHLLKEFRIQLRGGSVLVCVCVICVLGSVKWWKQRGSPERAQRCQKSSLSETWPASLKQFLTIGVRDAGRQSRRPVAVELLGEVEDAGHFQAGRDDWMWQRRVCLHLWQLGGTVPQNPRPW